jgi:hypothetical protein
MRSGGETKAINHLLMANGFGSINDPGLVSQLGYVMGIACKTHDDFRDLLNKCTPENRREMYESMRGYLKFEPKPLDLYVSELGAIAERKQLPVVAEDGTLRPFHQAAIETKTGELAIAQALVAQSIAKRTLELVCVRCTVTETFGGIFKQDCLDDARLAGWRYDVATDQELCPRCAR